MKDGYLVVWNGRQKSIWQNMDVELGLDELAGLEDEFNNGLQNEEKKESNTISEQSTVSFLIFSSIFPYTETTWIWHVKFVTLFQNCAHFPINNKLRGKPIFPF